MQRRTERETSPSRAFSSKHAGPQTGHWSALQLERGRTQDGQGQVQRWREVKSSRSRFRKPRGFAQVSPAVWARPSPCAQCEAPASGTFPRRPLPASFRSAGDPMADVRPARRLLVRRQGLVPGHSLRSQAKLLWYFGV